MVLAPCSATLIVATLFLGGCLARDIIGIIGQEQKFAISREGILDIAYPSPNSTNPYRIQVWSPYAKVNYPVLVVVRQQRRVISWQVPLVVETPQGPTIHQNTARTLCYDSDEVTESVATRGFHTFKSNKIPRNFTLSLSTSSKLELFVYVRVEEAPTFFIEGDQQYTTTFSASEPVYYTYNFPEAVMKGGDIKTVLIHITSNDQTCFVVSVQPKFCPVRDLNDDISYEGKFQTVNMKGGLTISRTIFDDGFYLVFVAKGNNFDCSEENSLLPQPRESKIWKSDQTTTITFEVRTGKTVKEYITAIMIIFGICFGVCLLFVLITYLFYRFGNYRKMDFSHETVAETQRGVALLEVEEDVRDAMMQKKDLRVADFVRRGKRNQKKAYNYFYHITNIAIFYGIPVIQLMIAYQRAVDASGDLDLCYHNFHCSQPYYFTDFNHIYSNIGYVLFGLLFLLITLFRNMKMKNVTTCGIPKHHGLYYAMGLALIFEGVLSACYHICPTQSNFQFDTSFMYVMAVLIMVKLYQNRHPDINASAYTTFSVLGIAVILAMFGILYNNLAIMIIFIVFYIILCFYMAFKIYFFGQVVLGWKKVYKDYRRSKVEAFKPIRVGQFVMLAIAIVCNISIAIAGLSLYPNQVDFGTFLLGILMLNAIMYAGFYMGMKLICKERICYEAIMYGILSLISWGAGSSFFVDYATVWSLTPAESRQLNQECVLFGFYDTHDIWHLLSAPALFFSFMFLQTLDDDLFDKPQREIDAF